MILGKNLFFAAPGTDGRSKLLLFHPFPPFFSYQFLFSEALFLASSKDFEPLTYNALKLANILLKIFSSFFFFCCLFFRLFEEND